MWISELVPQTIFVSNNSMDRCVTVSAVRQVTKDNCLTYAWQTATKCNNEMQHQIKM